MKFFILFLLAATATAVPVYNLELEPIGIRDVLSRDTMALGPREPASTQRSHLIGGVLSIYSTSSNARTRRTTQT